MYKILGGDGKEYGPVSAETLAQWIKEGRANAQTQVQVEGGSGWTALGLLPEFASAFGSPSPAGSTPAAAQPPAGAPGNASQLIAGPAIGLIVTAALGAVAQLLGLLSRVLGFGMSGLNAQNREALPEWFIAMSGSVGIAANIIGMLMAVVVFMGALKMKNLQNYGFAMTAAIVAMVPCVSPCCWIGLPIGLWALIVLNKPEVKSAFS